nr:MAG TPA: hypothetical protein [Caudoviricetes sp.]
MTPFKHKKSPTPELWRARVELPQNTHNGAICYALIVPQRRRYYNERKTG